MCCPPNNLPNRSQNLPMYSLSFEKPPMPPILVPPSVHILQQIGDFFWRRELGRLTGDRVSGLPFVSP